MCNIDTTKKTREEAAKEICAEDPSLSEDVKEIIKKSDSSHTFLHWDEKDIENLNKNIILFFMDPRGRNSISTHTLLTTCKTHNKEWHFYTDDLGIKEIKMPDGNNGNSWTVVVEQKEAGVIPVKNAVSPSIKDGQFKGETIVVPSTTAIVMYR